MRIRTLPAPQTERLRSVRATAHPRCFVCSPENPNGLGIAFHVNAEGKVEAEFTGSELFEGYSGILHGGLVTALLDGAMTQCLFACGCVALTAELTVRFRHPVTSNEQSIVRGWRIKSTGPLHAVRAELRQNGTVMAAAAGTFYEQLPRTLSTRSSAARRGLWPVARDVRGRTRG